MTARDHQLLRWLAEHYVLSTDQITTALFPSRRSARLRLAQLHQMEAVSRFADVTTGSGQYLYTLGPLGTVVHPTQFNDPNHAGVRAPRTSIDRTERIIGSRRLPHLLGTNQLFIDLLGYARTDEHARLARWWSEQHTTAAFAAASYAAGSGTGVQPTDTASGTPEGAPSGSSLNTTTAPNPSVPCCGSCAPTSSSPATGPATRCCCASPAAAASSTSSTPSPGCPPPCPWPPAFTASTPPGLPGR